MKTLAYIICHYGLPYFDACLAALSPQVDKIVVLYSRAPSQGNQTDMACPDSGDQLRAVAQRYPNVQWVEGNWSNEGAHTGAAMAYVEGYDWLVRLDTDEIIQPDTVSRWIQWAQGRPARTFSPKFLHFWRSFSRVCRDGHTPVRLTRVASGEGQESIPEELGVVYHMGYAQPTRYIEYKLEVQGHKPEFRPEWFRHKWLVNAQEDVHIVCKYGFWNTEAFDKLGLPDVLKAHPYWAMEVIE